MHAAVHRILHATPVVAVAALLAAMFVPTAAAAPALTRAQVAPASAASAADSAADRLPNPVRMTLGASAARRAVAASSELPSSFDLRDEGRVTGVKNQGSYGTCWAFANTAALESTLLPGETWNFSEDNLVTRSGFVPLYSGIYNAGGYDSMAIAYFARWAGPVKDSDDPYPSPKIPAVNTAQKHLQEAIMLPGRSSVTDNDLLKRMVYEHGALSVGMYYRSAGYRRATHSYYDPVAEGENHGVCIVGWDDDYNRDNFGDRPAGDGAFLVRNSWGKDWGDGGYFWVSYYDRSFAFFDCTSYTRVDALGVYKRVYQYDKLGLLASARFSVGLKNTATFANRFTARSSRNVVAVSFYATAGGATYRILAGTTLRDVSVRASGTLELPGFHTVALDTPLPVTKGRHFTVAVRLTTPGAKPIPIETPVDGRSSRASASRGQSYVRPTTTSHWTDLTRMSGYSEANVCLKAYTD